MNRKKAKIMKVMTTMCVMGMMVSGVAAASQMFEDMRGHWGESSVTSLVGRGIVNGYPNGRFAPNDSVSIDAFIKMAVETSGAEVRQVKEGERWSTPYYEKAIEQGLITKQEYASEDVLTRAITRNEMSRVLIRLMENVRGEKIAQGVQASSVFKDVKGTDPYATYITKAVESGVVSGYPQGEYRGANGATRVEAAVMIHRVIEPGKRVTKEQREKAIREYNERQAQERERLRLEQEREASRGNNNRQPTANNQVTVSQPTKYELAIKEAERLRIKRVPYVYGGNSERGMDCSAFVGAVYRAAGVNLSRSTWTQRYEGVAVSFANVRPGDLIYFDTKTRYNGTISHVGMFVGNNTMIHTGSSRRGIEYRVLDSWWRGRIITVRRHF